MSELGEDVNSSLEAFNSCVSWKLAVAVMEMKEMLITQQRGYQAAGWCRSERTLIVGGNLS